jgi:hypothetical protein
MSALATVNRYVARRGQNDVAGVLTLLTADVLLTVNGKQYKGMEEVHRYLKANYVPAIWQDEPRLLADGRVEMNLKVKRFLLTIPVRTVFTLRGEDIAAMEVTASLF